MSDEERVPWFIEANNEGLRNRRRGAFYSMAWVAVISNLGLVWAHAIIGWWILISLSVVQIALVAYQVFVTWPEIEEDAEAIEAMHHSSYVAGGWVQP